MTAVLLAAIAFGFAWAVPCSGTLRSCSSIQDAIDAADAGAVIRIEPGTYSGYLEITKPIVLDGYGEVVFDGATAATYGFPTIWIGNTSGVVLSNIEVVNGRAGIAIENADGVDLRGLVVSGHQEAGIDVQSASVSVLESEIHSNAGGGIFCKYGSTATISDCALTGNARRAIFVRESQATISDCEIQRTAGSDGAGILIQNQSAATVTSCTITENEGPGIDVFFLSDAVIDENEVSDNEIGINVERAWNVTILENVVSANRSWGIYIDSATCEVIGNTVSGNGTGVVIRGDDPCRVESNEISKNAGVGISAGGSNHECIANTVHDNGSFGVLARPSCDSVFERNDIRRNLLGVFVDGASPTLVGNTITHNESGGIQFTRRSHGLVQGCMVGLNAQRTAAAIYVGGDSDPSIEGCAIVQEGIHIAGLSRVTVRDCTVSTNERAGIVLADGCKVDILDTEVRANDGTGIAAQDDSVLVVRFSGVYGGPIGILQMSSRPATIERCDVYDNETGILTQRGSRSVITNSTIYGNSIGVAAVGGGSVAVTNTIIANSEWYGLSIGDIGGSGEGSATEHHNLFWSNGDDLYGRRANATDLFLDPQFANESGRDFLLRSTSPCIGSGESGVDIGAHPYSEQEQSDEPAETEGEEARPGIAPLGIDPG